MKILVTGGGGYIGSVLVPRLLMAGHHATVLDNFRHGENSLAACARDPRFNLVNGDARDPSVLRPLVSSADIVIPLAAIVGAPACARDHHLAHSTNFESVSLLRSMLSPDQKIIYPTTNSGYGVGGEEECTEESPLNPISHYGTTKAQAEEVVRTHDNYTVFRLATVFGASPRMRLDLMVNDFVYRAVSDRCIGLFEPHFRRNFVHVYDVARAFDDAILYPEKFNGRVFNVGDTRANMDKATLCGKISQHVEGFRWFNLHGEDPDKRDYIVSNAKIEATGWKPLYSIDDGIRELIKLYNGLSPTRYANV